MEWLTTVMINKRIARHWGTRAAAVFGWIFAQCQAQVPREECVRTACGRVYRKVVRVRVSCTQLGRLLHMSRHTVEAILHKLAADGLLDVWLPRGEDRTRAYSVPPRGFTLLHRWAGQWHTNGEECSLAWGLDTRVASKVGVNAAIVFQYLMSWSTGWSWGGHYTKGGRAWLPYTAAELSRWLPFLSDDVIEDALHVLEGEGLLARLRQGKVTRWSITDAGYETMGQMPPMRYADAAYMGETPPVRGRYYSSWGGTSVVGSLGGCEGARRTICVSKSANSPHPQRPPTADVWMRGTRGRAGGLGNGSGQDKGGTQQADATEAQGVKRVVGVEPIGWQCGTFVVGSFDTWRRCTDGRGSRG